MSGLQLTCATQALLGSWGEIPEFEDASFWQLIPSFFAGSFADLCHPTLGPMGSISSAMTPRRKQLRLCKAFGRRQICPAELIHFPQSTWL